MANGQFTKRGAIPLPRSNFGTDPFGMPLVQTPTPSKSVTGGGISTPSPITSNSTGGTANSSKDVTPTQSNTEIAKLQKDIKELQQAFYKGNFSGRQDFTKFSRFTARVKLPKFTALPTTCEVSEVGVFNGKLYVCSATNTWTIVGTQT